MALETLASSSLPTGSETTCRDEDPIARALELVWLTAGESAEAGEDRRASVRRNGRGDVSVATVAERPNATSSSPSGWMQTHGTSGRLIDLSMTGVSMVLTRPLEPGTAILVRLAPHEQGPPMDVPAEVVRSRELVEGQWKVVAKFEQHLCFDQAYIMTESCLPQ